MSSPSTPAENGMLKLVLGLAQFLHELMERQSLRRMEDGGLNDAEIERLGLALATQAEQLEQLRSQYGISRDDMNLDLGPLGNLF